MTTSNSQPWPRPADFSIMLQNPKIAFKDPDLRMCTIARDNNNAPKACSGAFAVVYKGTYQQGASRNGDIAIRVFSSPSDERQERYLHLCSHLRFNCPKCLVDFQYLEKGILHGRSGKWYPIIVMEWVSGEILYNYVRERCHTGDKQGLLRLSEKWIELASELSRAKIAHGDLQHANVMVTDRGELKLVDYDTMSVPALEGRRNLELGVVPYQNPQRTENTLLFPGLDHFSVLFIYVALRALTASPGLWDIYVEPPKNYLYYDKLLIRETDLQNPSGSNLIRDLRRSPDLQVRKFTELLIGYWKSKLSDIPPLDTLISDWEKVQINGANLPGKSREWDSAVPVNDRRQDHGDSYQAPRQPENPRPVNNEHRRVCVSYAWKDERNKQSESAGNVERFCTELAKAGIQVTRDGTNMGLGDRVSSFMRTIAASDVVYVFLSDAYLRSPNCMYELLLIWRGSQDDPDRFHKQIRVIPIVGTKIQTISGRLEYAAYWKKQRDDIRGIIEQHGVDVLGASDLNNWKRIQDFAHNVNEMLSQINDILLEGDFNKFIDAAIRELQ